MSSLNMLEGEDSKEEMISRASGIIAAAKGVIKIRQAMKLVGFSQDEICNMTLYQKVRRKSQRVSVVDKSATNAIMMEIGPVRQVNMGSGDTVTSTLSSAERTGENTLETTSEESGNSNNTSAGAAENRVIATPRRLNVNDNRKRSAEEEAASVSSKKSRRSTKEVQRVQANVIMQTKKESMAMKLAMSRIYASNQLPKGHKDKQSINQIVKEVNAACDSNISPKTAGTYVIKGRINLSPLKRGPSGSFTRPVLNALKWAYASYIQLEQAEAATQSSLKDGHVEKSECVCEFWRAPQVSG